MKGIKVNPRFSMLAGLEGTQTGLAQRPAGKTARKPTKAKTPEEVTQAQVEAYLDALGLKWFHMPAYVLRAAFGWRKDRSGPEMGAMAAAAAIVRGLPDLLIWDGRGRCLPIELKTDAKASKLTAAQRMWRTAIGTKEARSFEEAKALIDDWRK
jgi:hypothetical protein